MTVELNYGHTGTILCEVAEERVLATLFAPPASGDLQQALQTALEHPLDFPPMAQLFTPGDRVVLALDRHTPQAAMAVGEIWKLLEKRGVEAGDVTVLQPAGFDRVPLADPRLDLPAAVQAAMGWTIHDPTDRAQQAYLATTARGERVYLSRTLIEADVAVSVGLMSYDPVIGCRGTSSVFYPGLSSTDALSRAHGLGHSELGPDDERPLRQVIDEIAWLLGTQFTVQMLPAQGTGVAGLMAGANESVFRLGKEQLGKHWRLQLEHRAPVVVAAVEADAAGHGWRQVGAALATARNLVAKGGKVVILSQLDAELEAGMEMLRESPEARNVLQALRKVAPPDLVPATQLASAVDWARVYLLSNLDCDVVEDLFMTPLEAESEVQRLLRGEESCVLLGSAQHVYGEVRAAGQR